MDNGSPESTITSVHKAASVIENRGNLDALFPDLRNTFNDSFSYISTKKEHVQPVALKESIILPAEGLESIRHFDTKTNAAGIATALNRAYYSIKGHLYIWDYVERKMTIHVEDDDIVGVAFVPPKAGIFAPEINHLLIISTVREVKIIAVSYSASSGLKVFKTDMSTNTSGINMKTITGTKFGRVFMLGTDGNVWDLDYRREETWFSGRCSKRLHTIRNDMLFLIQTTTDPVTQIALSETGDVLYQLTENSHIHVTYLGVDGQSYKDVLTYKDAAERANESLRTSKLLDPRTFKIVSINPTSSAESKSYHLVAITSTGCRLYLSHHKDNQHLKQDEAPNTLTLSHVRHPDESILPTDVFSHTLYKDGLFVGVKNQNQKPTEDTIVTYSPDLGSLTTPKIIMTGTSAYKEFDNLLKVPGKIISIVESTTSPHRINELSTPYETPGRTLLALTTYGIVVLIKQRPIDMLYRLLNSTNGDTAIRLQDYGSFFQHFGCINGVSLCLGLICSPSSINNTGINSVEPVTDVITGSAKVLLETLGQTLSDLNPQFTSRHDGLALFVYRAINSIWSKPLVKVPSNGASVVYTSTLSSTELQNTQQILKKLNILMTEKPNCFLRSAYKEEEESLKNMKELVAYMAEGLSFVEYMIKTGISNIVQGMKPESQNRLKTITLKDLLTTSDGRKLANDLSYALVDYTFSKYDNTGYVVDVLTQYCKSFCGANDVFLYKATKQIYAARSATNTTQARSILTESLGLLKKIALHIPADKAAEIVDDFVYQGYPVYGVELALSCTEARDPYHTTNGFVELGCPANDARAKIFKSKQPFYDIIFNLLYKSIASSLVKPDSKREVFRSTFTGCKDQAFAYYVFEKFTEKGLGPELINESPPYLHEFLSRTPFDYERANLLATYYKNKGRYEEAAITYFNLARETNDTSKRTAFLIEASNCARCVTAPAKQYDMFRLKQAIDQNLEEVRGQNIPTQ
ncbi:hypothetical protein MFLAVUS_002662 [Mucor flavus]|uniref:Nucleoporin-domain-containing protein n=1 Tax=Mucor flavus TaxID=439312 RepID=A0ABP9YR10_9FUNG